MLERLPEFSQLRYLNLTGSQVDDQILSKIATMPSLDQLVLDDTNVTDDGLQTFPLSQLSRLSIRRTKATVLTLKALASETPGLTCLGFGGAMDKDAMKLIGRFSQLVVLSLCDLELGEKNFDAFYAGLPQSLSWLQLENINCDAGRLLQIAKSTNALMDLTNCTNDGRARDFLLNNGRLALESDLDTDDFGHIEPMPVVPGMRFIESPSQRTKRTVGYAKGEIPCENFRPKGSKP
jgi:hypothetical protein